MPEALEANEAFILGAVHVSSGGSGGKQSTLPSNIMHNPLLFGERGLSHWSPRRNLQRGKRELAPQRDLQQAGPRSHST